MIHQQTNENRYPWTAIIGVLLFMLIPVTGVCHSLYIQSSRYFVSEGKRSPLFFCYGHHIPVDDGVRAKKLNSISVHPPVGAVREVAIRNETGLHSYMVDYDSPGTYVLTAETNPGYYTVFIDKKGHERHTIKPKSAIMDKAIEVKTSLYSKQYTKTYVVCESPSPIFPGRVGLPLELVPTKDISGLKTGDVLELKIFFDGKPFTGHGTWDATYNGYSTESEDTAFPKAAISGTTLRIPIPLPGRWFVRYSIKIKAQGADQAQYSHMKHTATLVFQIPNDRKTYDLNTH